MISQGVARVRHHAVPPAAVAVPELAKPGA
jgi:hypothetical protein